MLPKFHKVSFNTSALQRYPSLNKTAVFSEMLRGTKASERKHPEIAATIRSMNDEHASRYYLQNFLMGMEDIQLRGLTSEDRPELVPEFLVQSVRDVSLTKSKVVEFQQSQKSIPIFGARTMVEIDGSEKTLVSIEATFLESPTLSPLAKISPQEALANIQVFCEQQAAITAAVPQLVYFPDTKGGQWRLAYYFKQIAAIPPELKSNEEVAGDHPFCIGHSMRHDSPYYDYFVDAHNGEVFYYFSSTPRLDVPVVCQGEDDEQVVREFNGLQVTQGIRLEDPLRNIQTFDFGLQNLSSGSPVPPLTPITHPSPNFSSTHGPAISAHYNAMLVFDFFNDELKRNGIDDKGMLLESVVNVYSSARNPNPPPNWGNAVWWNKKMWYGQTNGGAGGLVSYARYLDVIGHELTHGVTESTSDLIYRDLSGALNESFSDIFGIIIKNWYPSCPNPIGGWNWEMGTGLGKAGGPIRHFSHPIICGQPEHFSKYIPLSLSQDNGGVHLYSGIHNLAAYKILTSQDVDGTYVFTPNEVAILYYLTLTRLSRFSDFSDCRRVLLNVAGVYYMNNPSDRLKKQNAIKKSYDAVGIV